MNNFSSDTCKDKDNGDLWSCFTEYFKKIKVENRIIGEETILSITLHLKKGNIQGTNSAISAALENIDKVQINVAVTGECGAGKSSFINALRGVGPEEEGAAEEGVVETTMRRTPYKHPKIKTLTLWDLPGIGTQKFPPKVYLEKVKFQEYDFFVIVSATRFTKLELDLAKAIRTMRRNFYFVRTKVDIDLENEKKSKPRTFDREKILKKIRSYCENTFHDSHMDAPPIFLVSNHDLPDYDFPVLMDTLTRDLPVQKRHIFMLSLPNITDAAIERKRESLMQIVWMEAFKAGLLATFPMLGILRDRDVEKLKKKLNYYRDSLGVDDESLEFLAKDAKVPVEQLKRSLKSPYLLETKRNETLEEKLLKLLEMFASANGGLLATGLYFRKTFYLQLHFLDTVTEDAKILLQGSFPNTVVGQFSHEPPKDEDNTDLESSLTAHFKNDGTENKIISQETTHSTELLLQKGRVQGANSAFSGALEYLENRPLNVAVTGESGARKSSFINVMRGVGSEEEGAAETGTVETTRKRTPYKQPKIKTLTLCDLPDIGTQKFPPRDYQEKVKFQEYDFFRIVSSSYFFVFLFLCFVLFLFFRNRVSTALPLLE